MRLGIFFILLNSVKGSELDTFGHGPAIFVGSGGQGPSKFKKPRAPNRAKAFSPNTVPTGNLPSLSSSEPKAESIGLKYVAIDGIDRTNVILDAIKQGRFTQSDVLSGSIPAAIQKELGIRIRDGIIEGIGGPNKAKKWKFIPDSEQPHDLTEFLEKAIASRVITEEQLVEGNLDEELQNSMCIRFDPSRPGLVFARPLSAHLKGILFPSESQEFPQDEKDPTSHEDGQDEEIDLATKGLYDSEYSCTYDSGAWWRLLDRPHNYIHNYYNNFDNAKSVLLYQNRASTCRNCFPRKYWDGMGPMCLVERGKDVYEDDHLPIADGDIYLGVSLKPSLQLLLLQTIYHDGEEWNKREETKLDERIEEQNKNILEGAQTLYPALFAPANPAVGSPTLQELIDQHLVKPPKTLIKKRYRLLELGSGTYGLTMALMDILPNGTILETVALKPIFPLPDELKIKIEEWKHKDKRLIIKWGSSLKQFKPSSSPSSSGSENKYDSIVVNGVIDLNTLERLRRLSTEGGLIMAPLIQTLKGNIEVGSMEYNSYVIGRRQGESIINPWYSSNDDEKPAFLSDLCKADDINPWIYPFTSQDIPPLS